MNACAARLACRGAGQGRGSSKGLSNMGAAAKAHTQLSRQARRRPGRVGLHPQAAILRKMMPNVHHGKIDAQRAPWAIISLNSSSHPVADGFFRQTQAPTDPSSYCIADTKNPNPDRAAFHRPAHLAP